MHPTDQPAPEFPPGYQERFEATVAASDAAAAVPLPGPLLDAFLPATLTAAGFKLRPVVAADWAILQRIESPLLAELTELRKPTEERSPVAYTDEQIWELLWLWTVPVREARACLAKGLPTWRERVMEETADSLPPSIIADRAGILTALAGNLLRSLSTSVTYQSPRGPEAPQVFTTPPAGPRTGSAGG
jgi:hypothetical protein